MTVIEDKSSVQCDKSDEKYGGYILPFDHFNNLTVYSRIWKSVPQDRYDYLCGQIALQTEGLQQRINTTTCSDILAGVKFDIKNPQWVCNKIFPRCHQAKRFLKLYCSYGKPVGYLQSLCQRT